MLSPLRILLGLVLLAGAYVLAIAVVLLNIGIAAAPFLLVLLWPNSLIALRFVVTPLAVLSVTNVIAIGSAIVAASRKTVEPWTSVQIPASDAPELTAVISEIAAISRAPVPSELRLVTEANAAVSENPRIFGFGRPTRRLYLGLPVLMGMSRSQVTAILGHEIGHYAGGHSRFGAVVHRGSISLAVVCAVLRMLQAGDPEASRGVTRRIVWAIQREYVALDYKIFSGYAWLYNRLFFYVRRAQEYEADRIAAQVVGGAELAGALRRVYALSAAWSDFQNRFLRPMRAIRCVPDDPFDAFGRMLVDPGYQAALREWAVSPPQQPAAPLDSHPCLTDRLVRLNNSAAAARGYGHRSGHPPRDLQSRDLQSRDLQSRGLQPGDLQPGDPRPGDAARGAAAAPRPGTALLPVLPDRAWIPQLTEAMSGIAAADALPWDECVNRLGQARAAQVADRLLRAAAAVGSAGATAGPTIATAAGPTAGTAGATAGASAGATGGEASPAVAPPTLGHVLDLVQTRGGELAAAVAVAFAGPAARAGSGADAGTGTASREDPLTPLAASLLALLSCLLVATGRVRWQVTWRAGGDPLRLAADDVADMGIEQISDRVSSFVADRSAATADSISLHLLSLGVDPAAPVRLPVTSLGTVPSKAERPAAPGVTVVIHPAADPGRDRLQLFVRGIGIAALLAITVLGAVPRNHGQFSSPDQPAPPPGQQPALTLPTYEPPTFALPRPYPLPSLTLPVPIHFLLPVNDPNLGCQLYTGSASCTAITIAPGDTLSLLACRYRTSVTVLQKLNFLRASTTIKTGERLVVPKPKDGIAVCG